MQAVGRFSLGYEAAIGDGIAKEVPGMRKGELTDGRDQSLRFTNSTPSMRPLRGPP